MYKKAKNQQVFGYAAIAKKLATSFLMIYMLLSFSRSFRAFSSHIELIICKCVSCVNKITLSPPCLFSQAEAIAREIRDQMEESDWGDESDDDVDPVNKKKCQPYRAVCLCVGVHMRPCLIIDPFACTSRVVFGPGVAT